MVYTTEQRIESLAKAREAKKLKSDAKKQDKIDNPPPKGRPKKVKEDKEVKEDIKVKEVKKEDMKVCLLYTSPSPRDRQRSRMPSSA